VTDEFDRLPEELRASLQRHAREAPRGDLLAERIIHAADQANVTPRRGWRTWSLPVIAAGAVAAVVGAVVGIESYHPSASGPQPGHSQFATVSHVPTPTTSLSVSISAAPDLGRPMSAPLQGVRIVDLTFADGIGWALGTAKCVQSSGRCSVLFRTKGRTWWSVPHTPFNVPGVTAGCTSSCVSNIRFVNDHVGYVYGPDAFLMTTDGGGHWTPQPGGAIALESLDSNVIRVTATPPSGCPGPCNVRVETAAIGSTVWTPATGGGDQGFSQGYGVQLARGVGGYAYLLAFGHPTGGGNSAGFSVLYRSTDSGRSWQAGPEPCPQAGREIDSYAIAAGGGGRVAVLCSVRQGNTRWFVATSTDGGAHFTAQPGSIAGLAAGRALLAGDPDTVLVAAGVGMRRSTDGGRTWHRIADVTGAISWVGFESQTDGRALSADGNVIWTTHDGGVTWTPYRFGG
jgi:photosystem II stability/assembly factor-like uncharacterized protein